MDACPVEITRGFSKDNNPDLNQVVLQMINANRSTLPIWIEVLSGNTSDRKSFVKTIKKFQKQFTGKKMPTMVMDAAFYSAENIIACVGIPWITRVPETLSYTSAFALFFFQDPSLLEFQRRFQQQTRRNNLQTLFDMHDIPSDTQLRDLLDYHDYTPLTDIYRLWFFRLQRSKYLERFRVFGDRYLITLDGLQYFNSEKVTCSHYLTRHKSNGHVEHYHQVLQPALVHPDQSHVIPLAPEFIRRQDGHDKQDCEIVAGLRAISRIRTDHRQLPTILVGDALYSTDRFVTALSNKRFSYILGVKPVSHKTLFQDIAGLRRGNMLDRLEQTDRNGSRRLYEWVHSTPLFGTTSAPTVNYVEFHLFDSTGKRTRHFSWVTDLPITSQTVAEFVGRLKTRTSIP